ncbi:hypothetical protein SAMN05892883_2347 [Jatrophihabitans sp. GAS493]|uniref:hypothetical protein n=1 Tax=Jatrophihabitans sp. GAS493 TaxID=1907575 RepID=UPI000BB87E96|nr:hypothetical protein [Jatrophihabitans sp. GAS493]SOD73044.1 hypothetical protein SAMN05892883_2347 [Jatrophihabitans sp. GAS493]
MSSPVSAVARDDGETVGQVRRHVDGDRWVPETLFGGVLGPATEYDSACSVVLSHGMSSLLQPWWMNDGGSWEQVELVEIRADRVRVRPWSPGNLAVGAGSGLGRWVDPSEVPLALKRP